MDRTENGLTDDFRHFLLGVAEGEIRLYDDRALLMTKAELLKAIKPMTTRNIQQLINSELLVPVETDIGGNSLYHVANCVEFLKFLEKLEQAGFPLVLQQATAEMYHTVFWALSSDTEYEIQQFRDEKGREPDKIELAYVRVISDWAVSNAMLRIENDILIGETGELDRIKERASKWKRASLRGATFGHTEGEIEKIIKTIWEPPLQYFREREIKAFIEIQSMNWTTEESSLIWSGHFDFALCDENGILCLAVDYQGSGHYWKTEGDKTKVIQRDIAKRSICGKASVPLIQLDKEYAFLETHKRIFSSYLSVFLKRRHDYDKVIELLYNQLNIINPKSANPQMVDIRHRLDIYQRQGKGDSILGLLWDLHAQQNPLLSPLPLMLTKLDY